MKSKEPQTKRPQKKRKRRDLTIPLTLKETLNSNSRRSLSQICCRRRRKNPGDPSRIPRSTTPTKRREATNTTFTTRRRIGRSPLSDPSSPRRIRKRM